MDIVTSTIDQDNSTGCLDDSIAFEWMEFYIWVGEMFRKLDISDSFDGFSGVPDKKMEFTSFWSDEYEIIGKFWYMIDVLESSRDSFFGSIFGDERSWVIEVENIVE